MLKIRSAIVVGISLAVSGLSLLAQTNTSVGTDGSGPVYSLDQFGPCKSPADAEATYQKASKDIIAAGGGVIIIPSQTASGWTPKNNSQVEVRTPSAPEQTKRWGHGIGVTVVDARGTTPKILPPQTTGLEIDRVLNLPPGQSLGFWDYFPMLKMRNTVLNGSTSYREWLLADAPAGKDSKFYVATIRGVFPGMFMSIGEYGTVERLCVKSLGYDKEKKMWYFTADTAAGQPKGTIMGNKNHVNILDMMTNSHNENQTFDVRMWRYNYSQGDNYLFDARFKYMGDVHSTAGDENGVLYAAFIESLTDIFRGQVEKWDPETGRLKFTGSSGATLGTGRPIINLNPSKWITNGAVSLVNSGRIRFSAEAPVTDEAVGRYFALDEPDEYVPPATGKIRRWFLIDSVTPNADGTKDIKIIRHWWGAKSNLGAPKLYKATNYSAGEQIKWLKYVIAPGANAYDVAEGVNNPNRTVKLVPTPFTGMAADFAHSDPIEQAIGPDPFKPIPFRSWVWDSVPGRFAAPMFDIANHGQVMRDYVMQIRGGTGDLTKDAAARYDRNPPWDQVFALDGACNTGIKFGGDTANAAILFVQRNNRVQPIKWYYGVGKREEATLTVSPMTGDLNFTGGASFDGSVRARGLSGDDKAARNLRGKHVSIKAGDTSVTVTFATPEADEDYAVFIEQNWISNRAVVKRDANGFVVQFEKPAPDEAKLDWLIVR